MNLPPIGTPIPEPDLRLRRVRDLEWYEGPLLTEYAGARGCYLRSWVDRENSIDRWLLWRVSPSDLERYTAKEISLRHLILSAPDGVVMVEDSHVHDTAQPSAFFSIACRSIPPEYLPDEDAFIDDVFSAVDHTAR